MENESDMPFWWDSFAPEFRRAFNILHAQEASRLRKLGLHRVTPEVLDTVTIQIANYVPGKTIQFGDRVFDHPEELAKHIISLHRGLRPGKTFRE